MYTALYRTQRPEVFSEVIGQDHIVRILKNQINTETVSHAYLFCGTRGTGKTTTARILAKAVNCLDEGDVPCGQCANCMAIKEGTFMDVIEIDAASNNGVDNIRELRESVKYPPAVGRKKVYIIDEVHMLSTGAFNALLKTLEEPPENVMFILATTDPQKLPQTILSRCMRLDFKRVPEKEIIGHMAAICEAKGITITDSALRLLAANADGSVRDGLSILDQCLSAGDKHLDRDLILEFLGTVSEDFFLTLTEKVALGDVAAALLVLDEALSEGKDVKQLMKDWMSHYRNLLITKYIKNPEDMLNMSTENVNKLVDQSNQVPLEEINNGILTLSRTINDARYSSQPRVLLELAIVTIATGLMQPQEQQSSQAQKAKQPMKQPQRAARPASQGATNMHQGGAAPSTSSDSASAETSIPSQNLEEIWDRVFEEGEDIKGSFNLIRSGATLVALSDTEFKVLAQSEFIKSYVTSNQQDICEIMHRITGKNLRLVCKTENQDEPEVDTSEYEHLAKELESKFDLGIKIKVE